MGYPGRLVLVALALTLLAGTAFAEHAYDGQADVVRLRDTSGNDLRTLAVSAGNPQFAATVDWQLAAGTQYDLVADDSVNNGRSADFTNYPTSNAHIRVDGGVGDVFHTGFGTRSTIWFNFTQIETASSSAPVPEPASCALLALAVGGVGTALKRRRKQ